ncbi:MAG: selenium metabolism-associated LysR family transcriptional regulator [Desulfobacterales bacterium]|nr:selenium metabolism-associated LysR family transcriptional regulator [Desulfobacterales bacterium]
MPKRFDTLAKPPLDFDLRQLEIFCKIVELGSFSKAARAVFLTQASVSERIATLETGLGTRLLDRQGRRIALTRAGELFYRHAGSMLEMKRVACLEMENFLGRKQGEVHMGGSTIPGEYILPEIIGKFNRKYPLISVWTTIADTREIEARVQTGELELGVIGYQSTNKIFTQHELWQDELILAVPSDHRWASKESVSLEALFQEPFILRGAGSGTMEIMTSRLRAKGRDPVGCLRVVARFGTSTAVKEGIKARLGVSILSSRAIDTEVRAGILKAVRVRGIPMFRSFFLIKDRMRTASPISQALQDFLIASSQDQAKSPL